MANKFGWFRVRPDNLKVKINQYNYRETNNLLSQSPSKNPYFICACSGN